MSTNSRLILIMSIIQLLAALLSIAMRQLYERPKGVRLFFLQCPMSISFETAHIRADIILVMPLPIN